jgi:hypothetical protein
VKRVPSVLVPIHSNKTGLANHGGPGDRQEARRGREPATKPKSCSLDVPATIQVRDSTRAQRANETGVYRELLASLAILLRGSSRACERCTDPVQRVTEGTCNRNTHVVKSAQTSRFAAPMIVPSSEQILG